LQPSCMLKIMQWLCHKSQTYSYISETICKNLMFIIFFYVLLVLSSQKNPASRICLVCESIQLSVHCIMHSAAIIARHTNTMYSKT
jgi:hypothetical protein